MRTLGGCLTAVFVLALSGCDYEVPEDLARTTAEQARRARELADEMDARWKKAVADLGSPRRAFRACRHDVIPGYLPRGSIPDLDHQAVSRLLGDVKSKRIAVQIIEANELAQARSARWQMADRALSSIEYYLRPGQGFDPDRQAHIEKELARAGTYAEASFWTEDVLVLIDDEHEAEVVTDVRGLPDSQTEEMRLGRTVMTTTKTPYRPGLISGRAFLFDYETERIACAGSFTATNSRAIEEYTQGSGLKWTLRDDLRGQAVKQALLGLRETRRE
ncbi:MAG: hypothetical protein JXR96_00350 [Deltaproteobacteria bacterium]|nr:hypothetical protein [Deltaproteobacteria bacterium]